MIAALVPMKPLALAKQRFAGALADADRRRLVTAMLEDVLDALAACPAIGRRFVLTADPEIAALAAPRGAEHLAEANPAGLDAAVRAGAAALRDAGAGAMLFVPGDVPLAGPGDFARMAAAYRPNTAVFAPSHDGDGTNAMLLSLPSAIAPAFGPGSFARHVAAAAAGGLDPVVLSLPGLARDIDGADGLRALLGNRVARERYAFLDGALSRSAPPAGVAVAR